MIKGTDFVIWMEAERKLKRKEALTEEEQRLVNLYGQLSKPKLCGCGCGEALEPRIDGERHTIVGKGEVNSDCYFDAFGKEIEEFPILPPRLMRRVASATRLANESASDIEAYLARNK